VYGSTAVPTKICPTCGDRLWTQVGLDEHIRLGDHNGTTRRWVTGRVSPAGLAALQERGRQIAALNNARRRRCVQCGYVSTPAAMGNHLKLTGHATWTEAAAA
jgi:hypothetical protein